MMSLNFKKATQNRIYQDIVEQIQKAILDGRIKPGEKLPPERDLCELFETSRGTLREALRILEQKGLLDIKLGMNGGAYIRNANSELMAENLAMLIRSQDISLGHLAEFREGIEGTVAQLAARRALREDVARLEKLLEKGNEFRMKGKDGWPDFVRIDEQIHTEIARICGNPLYFFVLNSVHDNIHRYYDKFLSIGEQEMEENYQDLVEMVDAISKSDERLAAIRAVDHVQRFNRYMEKKKRQKTRI